METQAQLTAVEMLERFERDLARKGFGVAPNLCSYKLTATGADHGPAVDRTTPAGMRDTVIGWNSQQFESLEQATRWAIADGRAEYSAAPLSERKQIA